MLFALAILSLALGAASLLRSALADGLDLSYCEDHGFSYHKDLGECQDFRDFCEDVYPIEHTTSYITWWALTSTASETEYTTSTDYTTEVETATVVTTLTVTVTKAADKVGAAKAGVTAGSTIACEAECLTVSSVCACVQTPTIVWVTTTLYPTKMNHGTPPVATVVETETVFTTEATTTTETTVETETATVTASIREPRPSKCPKAGDCSFDNPNYDHGGCDKSGVGGDACVCAMTAHENILCIGDYPCIEPLKCKTDDDCEEEGWVCEQYNCCGEDFDSQICVLDTSSWDGCVSWNGTEYSAAELASFKWNHGRRPRSARLREQIYLGDELR